MGRGLCLVLVLSSDPSAGFWGRLFPSLKFPGEAGAEEKGDASPLLYQPALSPLPPIWFTDPLGEEDESHPPPPASSWQPAKAGRARWDAPLGLGRRLSFLLPLHLPQSIPLERDGETVWRNSPFGVVFLPPPLHLHGRRRL